MLLVVKETVTTDSCIRAPGKNLTLSSGGIAYLMSLFIQTETLAAAEAHLFEAEGHGEHTDSHDAVHHVHDQTPVRRRHPERLCGTSSLPLAENEYQEARSPLCGLIEGGWYGVKLSDSSDAGTRLRLSSPDPPAADQ